jgi:hypothetical protein
VSWALPKDRTRWMYPCECIHGYMPSGAAARYNSRPREYIFTGAMQSAFVAPSAPRSRSGLYGRMAVQRKEQFA